MKLSQDSSGEAGENLSMSDIETICTFTLGELFLGINVHEVHEVLLAQAVTPVPLSHPVIAGLINMRGQIVPAIDLRRLLHLPARGDLIAPPVNVVVRNGEELMSLLVDDVGDVLSQEARFLTAPPDATRVDSKNLFRGAYQLPQRLLLVFDTSRAIEAIVTQARSKHARRAT